ncbi:MAG TPA: hypothetical protein VIL06_00520 [Coriobacteriia bacterium]
MRLTYGPASPEVVALAADPVMAAVTRAVGDVSVGVESNHFVSLASAIVGQQLSTAAANTIWRRFEALGPVEPAAVLELDDDAVVAEVTRVKGVGRWTAEMFLLFSLARPDVLALADGGLLRAAGWALELGRAATGDEFAAAGEAWRPYRSIASLYLWACLDRGLVPRTGAAGGLTPREAAALWR